ASDRQATVLAVVDDLELLQGRRAPVRALLQGQAGEVAGIVCSPTADRLPAVVTAELHLPDVCRLVPLLGVPARAVLADERGPAEVVVQVQLGGDDGGEPDGR